MLPISSKSVLDFQEMAYVKAVMEYNDQILKGGIKPSLADKFSQTAQAFNDQVSTSSFSPQNTILTQLLLFIECI